MTEESSSAKDGEIVEGENPLPPEGKNWLALISNYTERPDLFLAEIEKHDPGFIKRMNEATERRAEEHESARFSFGKHQAYTGLWLSVAAAIAILFIFAFAVVNGAGFMVLLAIGIFYAITQGGSLGFEKIVRAVSDLVRGRDSSDDS